MQNKLVPILNVQSSVYRNMQNSLLSVDNLYVSIDHIYHISVHVGRPCYPVRQRITFQKVRQQAVTTLVVPKL